MSRIQTTAPATLRTFSGACRLACLWLGLAGLFGCDVLSAPVTDGTDPRLRVTSSLAGDGEALTTLDTVLTVRGLATDNVGIARVTYQLNAGPEHNVSIRQGRTVEFTFTVQLPADSNSLHIHAHDHAGRRVTAELPLQRDTIGPEIVFTSPEDSVLYTRAAEWRLAGSASDISGVRRVEIGAIPLGFTPPLVLVADGGRVAPFNTALPLGGEGITRYRVTATDGLINLSIRTVTVVTDRTPPRIAVIAPLLASSARERVAVLATDPHDVALAAFRANSAQEQRVPVTPGRDVEVTRELDLQPGQNVVEIGAEDRAGNRASQVIRSTRGSEAAQVTAGAAHACALLRDGSALCWGSNGHGQLGDGTTVQRTSPVAVSGGLRFAALSAGGQHTCGITTDGEAYCWGNDQSGQLGTGGSGSRSVPTAVAGGLRFTSISVGGTHTCGVAAGGVAYCWGDNQYGMLGNGTRTSSSVPVPVIGGLRFASISAAGPDTCGVTVDGAGYCWGGYLVWQRLAPGLVAGGLSFQSISTTVSNTCGVASTGELYCWDGRLGPRLVPMAAGVRHVSTSPEHACAVTAGGTPWCWGWSTNGEAGYLAFEHTNRPTRPIALEGVAFQMVEVGPSFTCGVTQSGAVYCWGRNHLGQLGLGDVW